MGSLTGFYANWYATVLEFFLRQGNPFSDHLQVEKLGGGQEIVLCYLISPMFCLLIFTMTKSITNFLYASKTGPLRVSEKLHLNLQGIPRLYSIGMTNAVVPPFNRKV
ncbi:hypothetical protein L596_016527 [Steinernema carpocapsae]|uniref:Uncharacterized protein n=1 Tax=Steinernema carpocapsae TaxID=34508 RepID=A0A4U5NJA1_STECR|nr:hypothetical protein L596_016527 [Steinernema carpocapsae]